MSVLINQLQSSEIMTNDEASGVGFSGEFLLLKLTTKVYCDYFESVFILLRIFKIELKGLLKQQSRRRFIFKNSELLQHRQTTKFRTKVIHSDSLQNPNTPRHLLASFAAEIPKF